MNEYKWRLKILPRSRGHVVILSDAPQVQANWEEVTGKLALMMTPRIALETQKREEIVLGLL